MVHPKNYRDTLKTPSPYGYSLFSKNKKRESCCARGVTAIRIQGFLTYVRMTKQRFVIDEFCCEKQNESMTFFVIDEFCSNRSNAA